MQAVFFFAVNVFCLYIYLYICIYVCILYMKYECIFIKTIMFLCDKNMLQILKYIISGLQKGKILSCYFILAIRQWYKKILLRFVLFVGGIACFLSCKALVKSNQYELLYTVKTNLENLLSMIIRFILILQGNGYCKNAIE